jgi:hypothetical protein
MNIKENGTVNAKRFHSMTGFGLFFHKTGPPARHSAAASAQAQKKAVRYRQNWDRFLKLFLKKIQ